MKTITAKYNDTTITLPIISAEIGDDKQVQLKALATKEHMTYLKRDLTLTDVVFDFGDLKVACDSLDTNTVNIVADGDTTILYVKATTK